MDAIGSSIVAGVSVFVWGYALSQGPRWLACVSGVVLGFFGARVVFFAIGLN